MTEDNQRKPLHQPSKVWINGVQVDTTEQKQLHQPSSISISGDYDNTPSSSDVKIIKAYGKMDLERKMNKLISQGYTPQGGPTVLDRGKSLLIGMATIEYTQIMIK